MGSPIELVITDLDNTLYDWVGFFAEAFTAMVDVAIEILGTERDVLLDDLQRVHRRHHDSERAWSLVETEAAIRRWPDSSFEERKAALDPAFHAFNRVRKQRLKLYPGVYETLSGLAHRGIPVVGHTEASAVNAVTRVERLGLTPLLHRVYAADSGQKIDDTPVPVIPVPRAIHKPDPRILLEVCEEMGIPPTKALYVGDSLSRDIGMAQQIGMRSAWAAYGTRHAPKDWATLVRVTHWTSEDVARAQRAQELFGASKPEVVLERFDQLLERFEFRAAGDLARYA